MMMTTIATIRRSKPLSALVSVILAAIVTTLAALLLFGVLDIPSEGNGGLVFAGLAGVAGAAAYRLLHRD